MEKGTALISSSAVQLYINVHPLPRLLSSAQSTGHVSLPRYESVSEVLVGLVVGLQAWTREERRDRAQCGLETYVQVRRPFTCRSHRIEYPEHLVETKYT